MRKMNKEKQKRKKGERVRRGRNEKKKRKGKERRKGRMEDFPALRWSKLDGPSTKVVIRNTIYVWTPKTWSFDKLHKVGDFPTWFTLSLKAIKWYGLLMGGHERP